MIIYHVGIALDTLVLVFRSFFEGALEPEGKLKLQKCIYFWGIPKVRVGIDKRMTRGIRDHAMGLVVASAF